MKALPIRGFTSYCFIITIGVFVLSSQLFATEHGRVQHLANSNATPQGLTSQDWASIRAAYEAHRHTMVRMENGYCARNPEQQWQTEFDGRGFINRPDAGGWEWGLELRSYGFAGQKRVIRGGAEMKAEGDRVTYRRDEILREWFLNDQRGLEHGFTIEKRPTEATTSDACLELDLAVRGNLRPNVSADGVALRFVDSTGATVLTYSGLKVWDAEGKTLPARFALQGNVARLTVDERAARYPLTVDPIAQQAYLKASNTDGNDSFGFSVAFSSDTVVIGAPGERSNATGINGDQTNNSLINAGAAYVFVRSGATWSQQAYLKASNTDASDSFGTSVAISGDTVVVGVPNEDSNAVGINGDQTDNSAGSAGAAYIFVRNGTTWSQQAYVKASNTDASDQFGYSVAIFGDTLIVGAFGEASNATGINGDQTNNSLINAGAAYVFVRSGATWSQQAYLKASNTDANDTFGDSVAISGETVLVGASQEASNATGINGDQADNSASLAGAAYVFVRTGGTWSQQAYLKASNTNASDRFGYSVAISGDTLVVGAGGEASNAVGINGDQTNNSASSAGAAYVFLRNGSTWSQQAYLKASNTNANDRFAESVAIFGNAVVVGAWGEDSNAIGINGDQTNNSASSAGAAYVFIRSGASWTQQAYLKASNADSFDFFGFSVAISDDTAVVGAWGEASNATGINGDQTDNSVFGAGAAYVFVLQPSTVTNTNDNGIGSLRQTLSGALNGETVTFNIPAFDPGYNAGVWTINLTSDELVIDKAITISGPGADVLTVTRGQNAPAFRIFDILADKIVTLEGMTISNGKTAVGGGIINNHAALTINNCALIGNTAPGGNGGGIFNEGASGGPAMLTISNSTLDGNSSDSGGGAIYNHGGDATLVVRNCTFSGNSSVNPGGGGIYNTGGDGGTAMLTVSNSTFSANSGSGGGIYNVSYNGGSAPVRITNSTFSENSGMFGGAIRNIRLNNGIATIQIGNTIFKTGSLGENIYNTGTITSFGYNLSNDPGVNNVDTGTGALNAMGDQVDTDPMLGPLKNNGGPTFTHAPLVNSPAIDHGKRDTIPELASDFDQRGFVRPVDDPSVADATGGDASDIGAVEVGSFVHPTSAASWKTHGGAGSFPIDLPFTGPVGIECRSGGASNAYQVIIDFANPVTYTSAALSDGTGLVATNSGSGTNQITLNLTGVTNAQIITLALFDANDGANSGDVGVRLGVLVGDANNNGGVTASDVSQVKFQSGQAVNAGNFRSDIVVNGVINATDVSAVKLKSGTGLP